MACTSHGKQFTIHLRLTSILTEIQSRSNTLNTVQQFVLQRLVNVTAMKSTPSSLTQTSHKQQQHQHNNACVTSVCVQLQQQLIPWSASLQTTHIFGQGSGQDLKAKGCNSDNSPPKRVQTPEKSNPGRSYNTAAEKLRSAQVRAYDERAQR